MNKKSIYNRGKFEREPEVAVEEDFKFEEYPECKIFEIDPTNLDYEKTAFLSNFQVVNIKDENNLERTVLMLIFYDENGDWFTSYLHQDPYFLLKCKEGFENDVLSFLEKRFEGEFSSLRIVEKMDLSEMNHLSGKKRKFIKLSFMTVSKMHFVRKGLNLKIHEFKKKYKPKKRKNADTFEDIFELIENLYEHDLSYSARALIDNNIRVAFWYNLTVRKGFIHKIEKDEKILEKPDFTVLAFDIETTKAPLKFPDADIDCVMLISYVIDQETFLIVNREILSKDIEPFDYNPLPGISSEVTIYNEKDEKTCLEKFFKHIKQTKPFIITSFNGDFFDIPFIQKRAANHNLDIKTILGWKESNSGKFSGEFIFCHLDCFYWVKRDAFLPHGSHGLKAVTKAKLGYNPIEVDPEDMLPLAKDDPQKLCEYSVSDAVATYYLYMKHIHDFVFALCMIVPMNPDDVLRRGSGTLCEYLLMAQAYGNNIVFPNKKKRKMDKYYKGHLIENETYVGGYVECLNNGIYRSDIKTAFKMDASRYESLIETTNKVIEFFVRVEKSENVNNVENINEVKNMIQEKLKNIMLLIKENGEKEIDILPLIYHVDVSSMYPNIILTNRLQPTAIVNNRICSNCIYNEPKNNCKKNMGWDWKATYYPISQPEYEKIKLENSTADLKQAIKTYCQKNYKRYHKTVIEYKEDTVCMREHPFYVDTIRDFRDLRYKYKGLAKVYKKKERETNDKGQITEANEAHVLGVFYDSLQLAHKIILNSFYGYVMKKGARWYSMEMAAMVTNTGAKIIQESRELMDKIGKPLELDTDGIWTLLPKGFPENFNLKTKNGKTLNFSFPCSLINWLIYDKYKNPQYQTIEKNESDYKTRTEMSIFFEIDGPYRAMVIPAAREENKKLKKRYCVFNFDGSISEIKGFEIKRRGELGIVKIFQKEIFSQFLKGDSLKTLYEACAETSRKWLRVITEKGKNMSEEKIIELFAQLKVLSKPVSEYNNPNSIAVTSAIRLSEILGTPLGNTGGLNCKYIISRKPINEKLSLRAIPTILFKLGTKRRTELLKKWLKLNEVKDETLKTIIDWDYYYERLVFILQKVVIIPAILQGLENPLPEVQGPDWVEKKLAEKNNTHKQVGINKFFNIVPRTIEDIKNLNKPLERSVFKKKKKFELELEEENKIEKDQMIEEKLPEKKAMLEDMKSLRLTLLKKKWREERQKKKTNSIDKIQMETQDLQAYAQQIEQKIRQTQWQVLKISKPENGFIKYWILINNKVLISKKIHIFKTIYINSINKKENLIESKKKLPREKTSYFLYKYDIEERDFHHKFTNLDYYLTNPNIEGVYETNIDLDFRAMALSGNICRLKKGVGRNKNFEMNDIVMDKLNKSKNNFDGSIFKGINFLFAWVIEIKNRLFAMIFTMDQLTVIKYQNYKEKKDFAAPYKNYLKESIERNFGENHTNFDADLININYLFCDELEEFNKLFIKVIQENRSELKYSPSLTIIESHTPTIIQSIKTLENHLPLLELKGDLPKDIKYSSLNWHLIFADFGIVKFKNLEDRILLIDNLSCFSQVPICNLGINVENSIIRAIDVMFARELDDNYCVWWFSKNKEPDLGTKKKAQFSENIFQQQILLCNFSTPCISENYVFEIDVNLFHFNSLIVSEIFKDLNKEVLLMKSKNKKNRRNKLFEEFTINNKMGFKIVKKLFLNWYKEVYLNDNKTADIILQNLVRWMCSEESYFFDPYLKQTFDKIVKNIFEDFIDSLEELGAELIYANPYKLFIKTNRKTYYSANNFIKFVLESILENTKFSYLKLKIRTVYKTFIFYDIYNYTGLNINLEDIPDDKQVSEEDINKKLGHTSKWKLKEFFPLIVQNYFENVFFEIVVKYTEFLLENQKKAKNKNDLNKEELYKKMENYMFNDFSSKIYELLQHIKQQQRLNEYNDYEEKIKKNKEKSIIQETSFIDKSDHYEEEVEDDNYEADSFLIDDLEEEEPEENFLNKRYNEPINKKKRKRIKKNKKKAKEKENTKEWVFPNFPGSKYKGQTIVLEFIKILFEILIRERHYLNDIFIRLKSDLLDFIGISRYSDEGNFENVFFKFNLMNIICKKCYMVRNIDVFMDFHNSDKCFKCICGSVYDKNMIENKILYLLKECYKFFLNQNQYCLDCKSIKEDYLGEKCYCGGNYPRKDDDNLEEFLIEAKNGYGNFKNLADLCEFDVLKSYLIDMSFN